MSRTYNFNAGPATLPAAVMEKAQSEFVQFGSLGFGILEASHRSPEFIAVADAAQANVRKLLGIGDDYAVLFLQGGASLQFSMVPMNIMREWADYADTGSWSNKAIKEAKRYGKVNVVASSKESNYCYIPALDEWEQDPSASYLHITSNNTIFGTQFQSFPVPAAGVPLVADMSSDIMSRPLDVSSFGLIYAGAQKNLGPSGLTLVIIRKDLAERAGDLPTMLKYTTHIENDSMYNTPPTFAIYMLKLVTDWVAEQGGVQGMAKLNEAKAAHLYEEIDRDDFYRGSARVDSRSLMNVTFNLANEDLEKKFVSEAKKAGMVGLKGHRSVGGVRASIYNAMPKEGVETLVSFMQEFRRTNG